MVKNLPAKQETQVLGQEDPLGEETATHSSILAWRIPWTRNLASYSPWGHQEWDTTERLTLNNWRPSEAGWRRNEGADDPGDPFQVPDFRDGRSGLIEHCQKPLWSLGPLASPRGFQPVTPGCSLVSCQWNGSIQRMGCRGDSRGLSLEI